MVTQGEDLGSDITPLNATQCRVDQPALWDRPARLPGVGESGRSLARELTSGPGERAGTCARVRVQGHACKRARAQGCGSGGTRAHPCLHQAAWQSTRVGTPRSALTPASRRVGRRTHWTLVSAARGRVCLRVLECPWGAQGPVSAVGAPHLSHTPLLYPVFQTGPIPRSMLLGCPLPVGLRGHHCTP